MQVVAHLASPVKYVRLSPSPVADFDIDGVPGRGTQNHETTRTNLGTPVTLGGGRFFSGIPHPHLP